VCVSDLSWWEVATCRLVVMYFFFSFSKLIVLVRFCVCASSTKPWNHRTGLFLIEVSPLAVGSKTTHIMLIYNTLYSTLPQIHSNTMVFQDSQQELHLATKAVTKEGKPRAELFLPVSFSFSHRDRLYYTE